MNGLNIPNMMKVMTSQICAECLHLNKLYSEEPCKTCNKKSKLGN